MVQELYILKDANLLREILPLNIRVKVKDMIPKFLYIVNKIIVAVYLYF